MIPPGALLTESYREAQRLLHADPQGYGDRGDKWASVVVSLVEAYQASSVLDYGCGQGALKRYVMSAPRPGLRFDEYDPAIPGKDGMPSFADLVVCTDVLEHVEPDCLDAVLAHLKLLARKAVFVVAALVPTSKTLPDGRNAHVILRPAKWWRKRCEAAGFTLNRPPEGTRKKKSHEWVAVLEP